jgi:FAD/FMN-containing dehydrogenase
MRWCLYVGLVGALAACATPTDAVREPSAAAPARKPCEPPRVRHYNGFFCCDDVAEQRSPASAVAAAILVRDELLNGTRPIRVIGNAHTGNQSICTSGLVIRTDRMKQVLAVEPFADEQTVIAEAGVTVGELNEWLHAKQLTLGGPTLEFRDATLGGAIGTAAHGSTLEESSVISSAVRGLWIVTPRDVEAKGAAYTEPEETTARSTDELTWRALRANLGSLGMVTKVRLAVVPDYNLRVHVRFDRDYLLWKQGGVESLMKGCKWGQIHWFPRAARMVHLCGEREAGPVDREAANVLLDPLATPSQLSSFESMMRAMAATRGWSCGIERIRYANFKAVPPQRKHMSPTGSLGWLRGLHTSTDVTGPAWMMMSSKLTPIQSEVPQNDFEIAVPLDQAGDILRHLKADIFDSRVCLPLVGVFLRFTRADDSSLIGHAVADGQAFKAGAGVMFVELVVYRPPGTTPSATDTYFAPYWKLVEGLVKRGGRPHWAKNAEEFFHTARRDAGYDARISQFRAVAHQLDPHHRFAVAFTDKVGLTAPE